MPRTSFEFGIMALPEDDTFTETMEGIGVRLDTLVPVYAALYAAFRKIEQARFDAEGPGWAPLAESTVAQRGSSHPILNRSGSATEEKGRRGGQLRKSLTTAGAKGAVVEPLPDGLFMGTEDTIARFHQDGTRKMPARHLVDLNEADAEAFAEIISGYVYELGLSAEAGVFAIDAEGL